jgi:hypothetical protein
MESCLKITIPSAARLEPWDVASLVTAATGLRATSKRSSDRAFFIDLPRHTSAEQAEGIRRQIESLGLFVEEQ